MVKQILDSKTVYVDVGGDPWEGQGLQCRNLQWLSPEPFMNPNRASYSVELRNTFNYEVPTSVGIWEYSYWMEGYWETLILQPNEIKTVTSQTVVVSEQGSYGATLHLQNNLEYACQFLSGLGYTTVQNPLWLNPNGSPPKFPSWSGLKGFPIPISPYMYEGLYFESIQMPMLSQSQSRQGRIVMSLVSPKDCLKWTGSVGKYGSEGRYDFYKIYCPDPATEPNYKYYISAYLGESAWKGTKVDEVEIKLTKDDNTQLHEMLFTFPPASNPIGSNVLVSFNVKLYITGETMYGALWGPVEQWRYTKTMLAYPAVGYLGVEA